MSSDTQIFVFKVIKEDLCNTAGIKQYNNESHNRLLGAQCNLGWYLVGYNLSDLRYCNKENRC